MIKFHSVSKDVRTEFGRTTILEEIDWTIHRRHRFSILGHSKLANQAMVRLLTGLDLPSSGWIERHGTVSPLRMARYAWGTTTPRQLIKHLSTLYHVNQAALVTFVAEFANLHNLLDVPVTRFNPDDRQRLNAALFYGIPFDYYVFDGRPSRGPKDIRDKCVEALDRRADGAGVVLVTHEVKAAREIGGHAYLLHVGRLHSFNTVEDCIVAFEATRPDQPAQNATPGPD